MKCQEQKKCHINQSIEESQIIQKHAQTGSKITRDESEYCNEQYHHVEKSEY